MSASNSQDWSWESKCPAFTQTARFGKARIAVADPLGQTAIALRRHEHCGTSECPATQSMESFVCFFQAIACGLGYDRNTGGEREKFLP